MLRFVERFRRSFSASRGRKFIDIASGVFGFFDQCVDDGVASSSSA